MIAEAPPPAVRATRVFIVEDEALIAMQIGDSLALLGYDVAGTAGRGEHALDAIGASRPDVVLMDIHLAGRLSGIETAARLRERSDVPVIFLTAYSDNELLRKAGEVRPYGYLVKPFEPREMHATIQMALYKHQMEHALREANERLEHKVEERTAELAASEANLAVTLDSIGDAVLATDVSGRVTRMNPVAEFLTGWPRREAIGRPIEEVFRILHEDTRQPAIIPVAAVLETGVIQDLANHTALVARDGVERAIVDSAAPIRDDAGRVVGVVLVFRDETEARERRRQLARQRAMLAALRSVQERFINAPDDPAAFDDLLAVLIESTGSTCGMVGEVSRDPDGDALRQTLALSAVGLATDPSWMSRWLPGAPPARIADDASFIGVAARSGQPEIANGPLADSPLNCMPPGYPLTSFMAVPVSAEGKVVGVVAVANRPDGYDEDVLVDIRPLLATLASLLVGRRNHLSRRAAEGELRELNTNLEAEVRRRTAALVASEQRYFNLVERINDAIVLDDVDGRLVYANNRFFEWFGLEGRTPQSIRLEDYVALEWCDELRERHDRRMRGEAVPDRYEFEGVRSDGTRMWLDAFVSQVIEGGRLVGTQSVLRDLTARKQEERRANRTQRLEAIGTLAGGIAHDLNNALTPVLMTIGYLRDEYPADTGMLETLERSVRHASGMVRHLLTFARGKEGQRVALPPRHLVAEIEKIVSVTFPKNILVEVRLDLALPMVLGDATQLHQVLLNLCVNARDAMPGGGTLTLSAEVVDVDAAFAGSVGVMEVTPGRYVALYVTDTGIGMSASLLDRIFDPFFTTKGPDKGTGLGLSTVLGIVKGHGGFLRVSSQPGHGSMFAVYLPAVGAEAEPHLESPEAARPPFLGHGETVLYVDDEPAVREVASAVIRRLNFRPVTATDGADGLVQAAQHGDALRVVITDLHMPHMDGLAFVRALRRILPDVPVIVASGRMDQPVAVELRRLGVSVILDKPFTQEMLGEALETALAADTPGR